MNKLNDWLQLAAALGVIAGLLLVAVELRQESNLTRAEMGFEAFGAFEQIYRSAQNEMTANAIAKACENPLEMTTAEHTIVTNYYSEVITGIIGRELYMQERGLFEDDLRQVASYVAEHVFGCEYGRSWWQLNRQTWDPSYVPYLDEALATGSGNYLESLEALEHRIAKELGKQGSESGTDP